MRKQLSALLLVLLGIVIGANLPRHLTSANAEATTTIIPRDTRDADRQAIRAHIDSIFKAYINVDCKTIRDTHSANWVGFTSSARSVMRGIDTYMNTSARFCQSTPLPSPGFSLADYKIAEIDYEFYGDVALVPYVAETWYGKSRSPGKLRSLDVYAKVNGEWTQVGSNIYLHPDMVQAQFRQAELPRELSPNEQASLKIAREGVWKAYFGGDLAQLEKLVPEEAIAMDGGPDVISKRADIFAGAKRSAAGGSKLVSLEFPRTETQVYGNTVILYTTFKLELETAGKRESLTGRGTETFVNRDGNWVNTGWNLEMK
ncbi:MAG: nuclear transport factor 2 family protein [Pyrinomonadaceae bacterium]